MGIGMDAYRTDDKGRVDLGKSWHEVHALKDDTIRARFAPDARPRDIYHGVNDVEYVLEMVSELRALFDRAAKEKATVAISFV